MRDDDGMLGQGEFTLFDSDHVLPEEDMAANLFVLMHCAREYSLWFRVGLKVC